MIAKRNAVLFAEEEIAVLFTEEESLGSLARIGSVSPCFPHCATLILSIENH
jgi:hypothetical protein